MLSVRTLSEDELLFGIMATARQPNKVIKVIQCSFLKPLIFDGKFFNNSFMLEAPLILVIVSHRYLSFFVYMPIVTVKKTKKNNYISEIKGLYTQKKAK